MVQMVQPMFVVLQQTNVHSKEHVAQHQHHYSVDLQEIDTVAHMDMVDQHLFAVTLVHSALVHRLDSAHTKINVVLQLIH